MSGQGNNFNGQFNPFGTDFSNFGTNLDNGRSYEQLNDRYFGKNLDDALKQNLSNIKAEHFGNTNSSGTNGFVSKAFYPNNENQFSGCPPNVGPNKTLINDNNDEFGTYNYHLVGSNNSFDENNNQFGTNNNHLGSHCTAYGCNNSVCTPDDVFGSRTLSTDKITKITGIISKQRSMATNVMFSPKEGIPAPKGRPPSHLRPLQGGGGRRDKAEAIKLETLRAEMPYLTREQTSEYRHTFYHNLCLGILKHGYHRTFSELFHLIRQQEEARRKAGPDSTLWNQTPLSQQPEKLMKMRDTLCVAEEAERGGDLDRVYDSYLVLATFFKTQPEDKWLMDHYYNKCLINAARIENDDNRKLAEAHLNIGSAIEKNGDLQAALSHFELFYTLSLDKEWLDNDDVYLHATSCEHLSRVYTELSKECTDGDMRVNHLKTAHTMAKESRNRKLEGQCGYRLGLAYESVGKPETALLFLRGFYESSKAINDDDNLGFACEAMAKAYERQNNVQESIKFLVEFVEVTARSGQKHLYSRACRDLGAVFNKLGRYEESADYFNKAFVVSRSLNDVESIHNARLQLGISVGHGVMPMYNYYVDAASKCALKTSLDWKNSRGDIKKLFGDTLSDAPTCTLNSRKPARRTLKMY